MSPHCTERKPVWGQRPPPFSGSSDGLLTGMGTPGSVVVRGLEKAGELELPVADPAVVEPVAFEQLVVVRPAGDVGVRYGRHEADALEALLHAWPGQHGG